MRNSNWEDRQSMSEVIEVAELFELELELPNDKIAASSKRLVGFENRYQRLHRDLRLLADPEELRAWSKKFHHKELAVCAAVSDRYPLGYLRGRCRHGKDCHGRRRVRQTGSRGPQGGDAL